ncbi:hypothetical protein [Novipirellula caenicola]|uniref:Prenyltransferase n=1 Tax=Novipirellula caenicola TaxID=1536901 RepID=A0ABP9VZZ9_9BACT
MATILSDSSQATTRSWRGLISIPNILSLDAPLVAIGWQWLIRSAFVDPAASPVQPNGTPMMTASTVVLFMTVWLIYTADRLLDCRRMNFCRNAAPRHRFAKRWSSLLWPLWCVVLITGGLIAFTYLHRELLFGGGILLGFVALYAAAVHDAPSRRRGLPKEFIVGSLFAIGVSLPVVTSRVTFSLVVTIALMAALFVLNCLCVATAQRPSDRQQGMDSAVLMYPQLSVYLPWLAGGLATVSAGLGIGGWIPLSIATPTSLSSFLLIPIAWSIDDRPHHPSSSHPSSSHPSSSHPSSSHPSSSHPSSSQCSSSQCSSSQCSTSPCNSSSLGELADFALLSPFLVMAIVT